MKPPKLPKKNASIPEGGWRGGDFHVKRQGCLPYLLGVKKVVLLPLRVFSLKSSTAGAFEVPFRVLSRKNVTGDNVLF